MTTEPRPRHQRRQQTRTSALQRRWQHDNHGVQALDIVPACVSDEMATLVTMACHGRGIVFAPDCSVQRELASCALVQFVAEALSGAATPAPGR